MNHRHFLAASAGRAGLVLPGIVPAQRGNAIGVSRSSFQDEALGMIILGKGPEAAAPGPGAMA